MTIKELQRRRRNGASLEILADLAGCTTTEIKEALGHADGSYVAEPSEDLPTDHKTRAKKVDDGRIAELHAEGLLPAEICERLNISAPAYYRWKKKAGVPNNRRPDWDREKTMRLYKQGLTDPEIAEQVGRSKSLICKWRKANNLPPNGVPGSDRNWCVKEAMKLYEQGYNDREVGEQVGASGWAIGDWRRGKGLRANGRRRALR